ncbi:MAG TPA: AAA family ATPase [Roseateles sp.]
MNPPVLALRLLGDVRLSWDGRDLTPELRYRKGLALLALLADRRAGQMSRREITAYLWPDLPLSAALTNLRQVLSQLTTVLARAGAPAWLQADRETIALQSPAGAQAHVEIDLHWLRAAAEALHDGSASVAPWLQAFEARWPAAAETFLARPALAVGPAFDDWVGEVRARAGGWVDTLLRALQQAQWQDGRRAAALQTARRRWERHPLDESAAQALMALLRECGDEPGARQVYAQLEQTMVNQLGLRPRLAAERGAGPPALPPAAASALSAADARQRWLPLAWIEAAAGAVAEAPVPALSQAQQDLAMRGAQCYPLMGAGFWASFDTAGVSADAALRAALACRAAVQGRPLRAGLVAGVVHRVVTPGAQPGSWPGLAGPLPGRAQRVAARAPVGQAWLDDPMRAVLGAELRCCTQQEDVELGPLHALRERPSGRRLGSRFVGRGGLLDRLGARWDEVVAGRPGAVVLRGEAGVGKSALALAFSRRIRGQAWVLHMRCLLQDQHQPLAPWLRWVAQAAGCPEERPAPERRAALQRWLEQHLPQRDAAADAYTLAELGAHGAASGPLAAAAFELALGLLTAACRQRPVLLLVDDLHWSDRISRELLTRCAACLDDGDRLLMLMTTRPDTDLPPAGAELQTLELPALTDDEVDSLVARLDRGGRLPAAQRARIRASCAGLPLMVESQTQALLHDETRLLPLRLLMQAELDRLGDDRDVLEVAAVWGQAFDASALQALLPERPVADVLPLAVQLRLLEPPVGERHRFRHALLHEAAYTSLPEETRRFWHRRCADELQRRDAAADAAGCAAHFEAAGEAEQALTLWRQAGEAALQRAFAADALEHFQRALPLAERLGHEPQARTLRLSLAAAALQCQGYGSPLAWALHSQVHAALAALPAPAEAERTLCFQALSGRYWGAASQGRNDGLAIAAALEAAAHEPAERLMACFAQGNSLFWTGRFAEALAYQNEGLALAAAGVPTVPPLGSADDLAVLIQSFRCWNHWFLGRRDAARQDAQQAIARALAGGHAHSLCFALSFAAAMSWTDRDLDALTAYATQGAQLGRRHGFPLWQGVNELFLAWAAAQRGELRDTASLMAAAEQMRQSYQAGTTTARWVMATTLVRLCAWREAEALLRQTLADAEAMRDHYCRADLLRLLAACEGRRGRQDELLGEAAALAEQQGAVGLMR